MRKCVRQSRQGGLDLKIGVLLGFFGFLVAVFGVLITGAKKNWRQRTILAAVFLVIAAGNVAIMVGGGGITQLGVMGAAGCGSAAAAIYLGNYLEAVSKQPLKQRTPPVPSPSSQFDSLDDDELRRYVERISEVAADDMRRVRIRVFISMVPMAVIWLPDSLGVPTFVPFAGMTLGLAALFVPASLRFWRSDLSRMDSAVELTRRGVPLPEGAQSVLPVAPVQARRLQVPMVMMFACLFGVLIGLGLMFSEVVPMSVPLMLGLLVLVFMMFACLGWFLVVVVQTSRGVRADQDSGGAA
jgi:hypothetical protein